MTWAALLREGAARLRLAPQADPEPDIRQDARLLLSWASGRNLAWLLAHDEEEADAAVEKAYLRAIARRIDREPVAHLTGMAGFDGHVFEVCPHVLIPRPETEQLVEIASAHLVRLEALGQMQAGHRMLDIGTGSGCIAISLLLRHPRLTAVAVDISTEALMVAERNARSLGVADRIHFVQGDVLRMDAEVLLQGETAFLDTNGRQEKHAPVKDDRYQLVVSNPPYIPSADVATLMPDVRLYEPLSALDGGTDGLVFYRRLAELAKALLAPDGQMVVEIGWDQGEPVPTVYRKALLGAILHRDLSGHPRIVSINFPETENIW